MNSSLQTLFWEATLNCNAGCPFCGSNCGGARYPDLDGDIVVRAFETVAQAYDPSGIMVNVTGGEPLLRPDLFQVMGNICNLGFPWGMVTNASLITEETIRKMKAAGMRTISVSLDDLGERHEKLRALPGAFSRITDAIRSLAGEAFLDHIQITSVITRENLPHLEEMLAFFSRLPVDSWRIVPVDPIGRCREHAQLLLRAEDFEELFRFFERHAFHEKPILTASCSHYLGAKDTLYRAHAFHCSAGKTVASILADGSIFVCPNVPRRSELIQGNICRDNLVRVWEDGFQWFRQEENRKLGPCARCPAWEKCRGDSLHSWDFETQSPAFCSLRYPFLHAAKEETPESIVQAAKEDCPSLKGVRISYGSSSPRTVYFMPQAAQELYCYFHWGKKHPANLCEQMTAAVGRYDGAAACVEALIPVPLPDRGEKTASFSMDLHAYVLEEIALLNRNLPLCGPRWHRDAPLRFLGYIHSHPGELDAAFSTPDLELHGRLKQESAGEVFSGIVNPQKKDLCIYWDSVYSPVDAVLLADSPDAAKWE